MSKLGGCLGTFIGLLLFGGLCSLVLFPTNSSSSLNAPSDLDACVMAQSFIEQALQAPATAVFPPCRTPFTRVNRTFDDMTVYSYVDAQNGFGALLRADTMVQMTYDPATRKWRLLDIAMAQRPPEAITTR